MTDFKYRLPIYEVVDEEGSLKFLFNLEANNIPNIGEQIVVLKRGEDGSFEHRLYFKIIDKLIHTVLDETNNSIFDEDNVNYVLYVEKQIDEPVLNC